MEMLLNPLRTVHLGLVRLLRGVADDPLYFSPRARTDATSDRSFQGVVQVTIRASRLVSRKPILL